MSTKKKKPSIKAGTSKAAAEHRRKVFAEAYLANGGNATEAAKAAGYSEATARQQGSRLLSDVNTQALIGQRQSAIAQKYELTAEHVLKNLAQAIYFDPRKLYREDGSLKDVFELDDDTAMALSGVEVKEEFDHEDGRKVLSGYTKKLKWLDKNTARDQALKHLGLFQKDNAQRGPLDGLPRDVLKQIVEHLSA